MVSTETSALCWPCQQCSQASKGWDVSDSCELRVLRKMRVLLRLETAEVYATGNRGRTRLQQERSPSWRLARKALRHRRLTVIYDFLSQPPN